MSASGIRMGKVYVEIGADQKALNKALKDIQRQVSDAGKALQSLGAKMMGVGAAAVSGFAAATKVFANAGNSLRDMSMRTGASVEALSSLGYVAAQSGASMEDLEGGMQKMQKAIAAAEGGNKAAISAFSQLGISLDELSAMSPDDQMLRIGDALARIQNPAQRAAMAMKIFGRGGTALLPMLGQGADAIREMQAEAERLGIVMSTKDADAADAFNHSLAKLRYVLGASANAIGSALAPALTALVNALSDGAARVAKFIRENAGMVQMALAAAVALATTGAAVYALGTTLVVAGNAFSTVSRGVQILLGPLKLLSNLGIAVGQSFLIALSSVVQFGVGAAVSLATVLGPIGLIAAAVVGIGVAVAAQAGLFNGLATSASNALGSVPGMANSAGQSIKTAFGGVVADATVVFSDLTNLANTTFGGISDAIAANDYAGAAEVAWLGIQAAWLRGTAAIMSYADQWVMDLQNVWTMVSTYAMNAADGMFTFLQQGFNNGFAVLQGVLDNFINGAMAAFDTLVGEIQKSWNYVQSFFQKGFDLKAENEKVDDANKARAREREVSRPGVEGRMRDAAAANETLGQESKQRQAGRNAEADQAYLERQQRTDERAKARGDQAAKLDEAMQSKREQLAAQKEEFDRQQADRLEESKSKIASPQGAAVESKAEVAGTFSAAAIGGMGFGQSLQQKQVDLLNRIADNTEGLGEDGAEVGE